MQVIFINLSNCGTEVSVPLVNTFLISKCDGGGVVSKESFSGNHSLWEAFCSANDRGRRESQASLSNPVCSGPGHKIPSPLPRVGSQNRSTDAINS